MTLCLTELVRYLAAQSWQIAVLTLLVAVVTWALRHKTAHIRYLLWLIVLARCLVPPFFAVPLKILPQKTALPAVVETPAVEHVPDTQKGGIATELIPRRCHVRGSNRARPIQWCRQRQIIARADRRT